MILEYNWLLKRFKINPVSPIEKDSSDFVPNVSILLSLFDSIFIFSDTLIHKLKLIFLL